MGRFDLALNTLNAVRILHRSDAVRQAILR